jgi:hypothetical protein
MKKLLLAVCILLSASGIAQDSKMSKEDEKKLEESLKMLFDSKIDMTVDAAVYAINDGNTYMTESQDAGIIAMMAPKSFAKMKDDLEKKGNDAVDKGEMSIDGQKILFIKQIKEKEGREFAVTVYCKENDADSSIMVTSFCEKDKEAVYKPHAEKAIASAKLVK